MINLKGPINQKRQLVFIHRTGLSGWWWWLILVNNCVWGCDSQVSDRITKNMNDQKNIIPGGSNNVRSSLVTWVNPSSSESVSTASSLRLNLASPQKLTSDSHFYLQYKFSPPSKMVGPDLPLLFFGVFFGCFCFFFNIFLQSVYISALLEFSSHGYISIIFLYHPPFQKVNKCVWDVKRSMPEMRFIDLKRIWNA